MTPTKVIPKGHTFLNVGSFMTTKAKDIAADLFKKADNRNPDIFDMYIYNGLSCSQFERVFDA